MFKKWSAWIVTIALLLLSFIDAPYPAELWLQHAPTVAALLLLIPVIGGNRLSVRGVQCLILFLWLHLLGARWIYSYVPYDRWCEAITGFTLSEAFRWERNHYDRMVHLASGLLLVRPASEVLQRYFGMRPAGAALMSVSTVLAVGAVYEILEWQIAVAFSPRQAEAYNGQQGDVWDAQKDLALAGLGAVVAAILLRRSQYGGGVRDEQGGLMDDCTDDRGT